MEKSSIDGALNKLACILYAEFGVAPDLITPDASFRGDLGLDSMEESALMIEIEDAFGIEIPNDDARKILTVQDAINYAVGA